VRYSGASINGVELVLVTVNRTDDEFTIEGAASTKMGLNASSDQESVRAFFAGLAGFVRINNIDRIAIRGRQAKGGYSGGPLSFKIEGFLQILESCSTIVLMPPTIFARAKRYSFTPPPRFKYQNDAFATACAALVG
jgi:hypothetical protein